MKILDDYKESLEAIYDYFGFKEDWAVFPLDDARDYWWFVEDGTVQFFDSKEAYETEDGMHTYENEIMEHRFYPKVIYEGKEYTMIMVDTHTDGNRFLQIFDNSKRLHQHQDNNPDKPCS